MGGAVVAAIAVVMVTMFVYSQMISGQDARNQRLTDEIVELEKSIEEIDGLERQKERSAGAHGNHRAAAEEPSGDRAPLRRDGSPAARRRST